MTLVKKMFRGIKKGSAAKAPSAAPVKGTLGAAGLKPQSNKGHGDDDTGAQKNVTFVMPLQAQRVAAAKKAPVNPKAKAVPVAKKHKKGGRPKGSPLNSGAKIGQSKPSFGSPMPSPINGTN